MNREFPKFFHTIHSLNEDGELDVTIHPGYLKDKVITYYYDWCSDTIIAKSYVLSDRSKYKN